MESQQPVEWWQAAKTVAPLITSTYFYNTNKAATTTIVLCLGFPVSSHIFPTHLLLITHWLQLSAPGLSSPRCQIVVSTSPPSSIQSETGFCHLCGICNLKASFPNWSQALSHSGSCCIWNSLLHTQLHLTMFLCALKYTASVPEWVSHQTESNQKPKAYVSFMLYDWKCVTFWSIWSFGDPLGYSMSCPSIQPHYHVTVELL